MELGQIVLSEPLGVTRIHDMQGRRLEMRGRYASALIVPVAGRLCFTQNEREIIADAQRPIFVPEGSCYLNECLVEADSLLFSFHALQVPADILPLCPIDADAAWGFCERLELLAAHGSSDARARMLGETYALLGALLRGERSDRTDEMLSPALRLMAEEYARPGLSCAELARAAHLSEVYLRRLFVKRYGRAPFQYLTGLRMDRARSLLLAERRKRPWNPFPNRKRQHEIKKGTRERRSQGSDDCSGVPFSCPRGGLAVTLICAWGRARCACRGDCAGKTAARGSSRGRG